MRARVCRYNRPVPDIARILLVEDDPDSLTGLFTLLTRAGHSVITAANGEQAIDLLAHGIAPRLLILDLMMPKVTGWDVLRYLREDPELRHAAVIVTTALEPAQARTVGADVLLQKPLQIDHLLREVSRLMDPAYSAPRS